ncbi:MAG: hypothetical protein RQ761_06495 [Bacteroidales bacterium]|nr:hypothetical protein [Bacteroidales bacterium]
MKKKEVPQDNEGLQEDKLRDLCYAVDEDGSYVTVKSSGWEPKNAAMKQAWEEVNIRVEEARQKVLRGEYSILAYHMEKNIMTAKLLSQYTGIPRRKIRKHLKPEVFEKLRHGILQKYAEAFNITTEQLTDNQVLELNK